MMRKMKMTMKMRKVVIEPKNRGGKRLAFVGSFNV